ncbi:flagellar hook-associated protein FlgL [Oceanobacter kriegii]|uniref:flagellar hook-associated protein FlgL n=1 Tax=Oceanobacter kriegii TaxID=64972 RepID=UPI000422649F|nr:flagellar hook-associated protein FlgL [Oceanobacter kriegii]
MRVSTLQIHRNGLANMLSNQEALTKTQQQVSSGVRVNTAADDPIAAARILQIEQQLALTEQFENNMISATNRLELEESTLSAVTDYYDRLRELTVQAGSGVLAQTDREAIAAEVEQIEEALVELFNTKDATGEYIFAGFQGGEAPFVQNANGRYSYEGDDGQRFVAVGSSTTVATGDSGIDLFVDIPSAAPTFTTTTSPLNTGTTSVSAGFITDDEAFAEFYPDDIVITFNADSAVDPAATNYTVTRASDGRVINGLENQVYDEGAELNINGVTLQISGVPEPGDQVIAESTPKQSITDTIFRFTEALNTLTNGSEDQATLDNLIEDTLNNLDAALAVVSSTQSKIGARLNTIENTELMTADMKLANQEALSDLRDADLAEAVSRMTLESTLLEAAQQSYTVISNLSLFNKL